MSFHATASFLLQCVGIEQAMLDGAQKFLILCKKDRLLTGRKLVERIEDRLDSSMERALSLLLADCEQRGRALQVRFGIASDRCQVNDVFEFDGTRREPICHGVEGRHTAASKHQRARLDTEGLRTL